MKIIKLDSKLTAEFDAIPNSNNQRKQNWTKEADAFLVKYWPIKNQRNFLEVFSKHFFSVSENPVRTRYRQLTQTGS